VQAYRILAVMTGLAYREWRQYRDARAVGFRVLDIQNALESFTSSLADAESGSGWLDRSRYRHNGRTAIRRTTAAIRVARELGRALIC
jgi:hypothetical protein